MAGSGMGRIELAFEAVPGSLFVKSDFWSWSFGWWLEQRQEFLVNIAQSGVVLKEGFVDFSQALQNCFVGGQHFTLLDESADDVNAHRDGLGAVQDVRSHDSAVLSEGVRKMFDISALRIQYRILRS
jgi:hypothetical protein